MPEMGKWKESEKTCPISILSTTNPTQAGLESGQGLHSKRITTVLLIHGEG
jgi:hypothetical protein